MEKDYLDPKTPPKKIGPFPVEAYLARGGMSVVFLGTDPESSEKKVILKVLLPQYIQDKWMNEQFINEAKILSQVFHPNIPKIYKIGKWEHGVYIAMEYFQGISLRSFIIQQSFSLKRALEIILQIGYALYHLHSHGIVHRDLKPENVILTEEGEVKVIDFSLSQLIPENEEEHLIQDRYRVGTPFYMSPEQRDNPKLVTKATDIYALGIIAFELILGRSTYGVIQTFLLPQGLRQIIEKAIQVLPELRYDDVFDFINAISAYKKKLEEGKGDKEIAGAGPVRDLLGHVQSIFLPQKAPSWPQIEISIAYQEGMAINALYLDFFALNESQYAIFLAEPLRTGVESLFHMFALRGMARLEAIGKKHFAAEMFQSFSKSLYNDPMDQKFAASALILEPKQNKLKFSSCKFVSLWQISPDKVKEHHTKGNSALGVHSKAAFKDVEIDWGKEDLFVLYSHPMEIEKRKERQKVILASQKLEGQKLAQRLLNDLTLLSPTSTQKGSCLIAIRKKVKEL